MLAITTTETAIRLGMTERNVQYLIRKGRLDVVGKKSRSFLISVASIIHYQIWKVNHIPITTKKREIGKKVKAYRQKLMEEMNNDR